MGTFDSRGGFENELDTDLSEQLPLSEQKRHMQEVIQLSKRAVRLLKTTLNPLVCHRSQRTRAVVLVNRSCETFHDGEVERWRKRADAHVHGSEDESHSDWIVIGKLDFDGRIVGESVSFLRGQMNQRESSPEQ